MTRKNRRAFADILAYSITFGFFAFALDATLNPGTSWAVFVGGASAGALCGMVVAAFDM